MWDWLIVGLIVLAAVLYVVRRFWRMGRGGDSPSCGCSGCEGGPGCSAGARKDGDPPGQCGG